MTENINDKFEVVFNKLRGCYVHKELFLNHDFKFVGEKYTYGSSLKNVYCGRGFVVITKPRGRLEELVNFYRRGGVF